MLWCKKGRVNQSAVRSILLDVCETWTVREADERMWEFLDNISNRRILRVRRGNCAPSVDRRLRLGLTSNLALLVQRRLCLFGHAAIRPEGEVIKDLVLPHCLAHGTVELEAR